jgi:hypothetical protein
MQARSGLKNRQYLARIILEHLSPTNEEKHTAPDFASYKEVMGHGRTRAGLAGSKRQAFRARIPAHGSHPRLPAFIRVRICFAS